MKISENFYIIDDQINNCKILFHRDSNRIAVLARDMDVEKLDYDVMEEQMSEVPRVKDIQPLQWGKDKITLNYMSSRTCNLGCRYCFAEAGEYGEKKCKPKFFTYEMYMEGLKVALENCPQGIKRIDFFGGEPVLNFMEIMKFVPDCINYIKNKGYELPEFSMTTNATLLTDEIIDFLIQYNIRVSISLDGGKEINDKARLYKSLKSSVYDSVVEKCKTLEQKGKPYMIAATINAHHIHDFKPNNAIAWAKEMERFHFFNLSIIPAETDLPDLAIRTKEQLENLDLFTRELVNYYLDKLQSGEYEKIPTLLIRPMFQTGRKQYYRSCSSGQSFIWDTDGSAYPCHMFCNDPDYKIGDMKQGFDQEKAEKIANCKREDGRACQECIAKNICSVWCKGLQYLTNQDIYTVCESRCTFQRAIMEECIKRLAFLAKNPGLNQVFWDTYKIYSSKLERAMKGFKDNINGVGL